MLERLQDGDSGTREVRLEPSLVVRDSTGPAAAGPGRGSAASPTRGE
jgi:hypothetical protein